MKIATIIAQVLMGIEFVVFGSNAFLHFLPATLPPGLGGQFLSILLESKYVLFVGAVQVIGGLLLLVNRAGARVAGAGAFQYFVVPWIAEPCGVAAGSGFGDSVDLPDLPLRKEFCGNF